MFFARKKQFISFLTALLLVLLFLCGLFSGRTVKAAEESEEKENVIIVLDPGHGGKNEGALWNGWVEKEITMVTAEAMKEHLEKFDGVTVYLTHSGVEDNLDLEERVAIAKSLNADYLICLHYNMSGKHTHYGSELWIPRRGNNNRTGYQIGTLFMDEFKAIGLSDRGIKTRKNRRGQDYYGILRASQEMDVPCILVEHAHLDHKKDAFFTDEISDFRRFGRLDAEAVAKYYGLKSSELNEDYSSENYRIEVNSKKTYGIPSESINGDYVIPSKIDPVEDDYKVSKNEEYREAQELLKAEKEKAEYEEYKIIKEKATALSDIAISTLPKANAYLGDELDEDPAQAGDEQPKLVNGFSDLDKEQQAALLVVFALIITGILVGLIKLIRYRT